MVEAIIFSAVSIVITGAIVFAAVRFLDPYVATVFETKPFLTDLFLSHILLLFSAQFGAVLLLTLFTSLVAMRRYLRA